MTGAYNKLNSSQAAAMRKLNDYHIFTNGRHLEIVIIHQGQMDRWGEYEASVLDIKNTNAVVNFPPGEMPLIRLRDLEGSSSRADSSALYFYDILPTEAYFKWEDQIENGDIFYFPVLDENGNKMPILFKTLDQKGAFSSELIWRKFLCAPITSLEELPDEVAGYISSKFRRNF